MVTLDPCACGTPRRQLSPKGRPSKRCLGCLRKQGSSSWRRTLARAVEILGEDGARDFAEEQGVPFSPATTGSPKPPAAPSGKPADLARFAVALYAMPDVAEAARVAGIRGDAAKLKALATQARKTYSGLAEGSPSELARHSYAVMVMAILRLQAKLDELSPGALSQVIKPLHAIWQELAGSAMVGDVTVDFGNLDESES